MGVLSDGQILDYIKRGELVLDADEKRAIGCAYEFTVGKIFESGTDGKPIDWRGANGDEYFVVKPGSLVWLRMKNTVKLSNDICAFWWQTNALSRQGLMPVNMSVVAPGYKGPLACLFVNFGKEPIRIGVDTPVARLVFMRLEQEPKILFPSSENPTESEYDGALHEVALRAPLSLLNLTELSRNLKDEFLANLSAELQAKRETLGRELADAAAIVGDRQKEELATAAKQVRDKQKEEMRTDLSALIRASFVYAVLGLVILILATQAIPWIQSLFHPNLKEIVAETVEHQLSERFLIPSIPSLSSADRGRTLDRLVDEAVKRELATRFPPSGNLIGPARTTDSPKDTPGAQPTSMSGGHS